MSTRPGPDEEDTVAHFDNREANPNSGGPRGLEGDMGISSERTGPLGDDPRGDGIEGTGTKGSALRSTDGETVTREGVVTDDTGTWQGVDHTTPVEPQHEPQPDGIEDEKSRRG
jgi:hypothetical protein